MLFCIQILKNYSTSEYGFLKFFATCEQWVRIYRTYYSFGCKNNIIILIEDIYTLSPHSLYTVQTTLSSSHSFSSVTLLPLSPTCRSSTTHATPITLFPSTFFSLFTILLYPLIEDSRVVGLILGFVWNFWVSWWWSVWRVVEVWLESTGVGLKWLTLVCVLVVWISGWFCDWFWCFSGSWVSVSQWLLATLGLLWWCGDGGFGGFGFVVIFFFFFFLGWFWNGFVQIFLC